MSTPNFLRDTLRQSLQDVLSEVSFDSDSMARAPVAAMPAPRLQNTSSFGFASGPSSNNDSSAMKHFGFYNQGGFSNNNGGGSPQVRPSAALGISSEELMMAAAAEKRMLEEKKMLMNLDRARAHMAFRQKVLQDALQGRGSGGGAAHQNSQSLLSMFQNGGGNMHMNMPQQQQGFASAFGKHMHMMPTMSRPSVSSEPPKDALQVLGTSLRQSSSPYIDVSDAKDPDPNDTRVKKTRGGVTEPFPERLHRLLKEISDDGNGDVISFYNHGRAFGIHKPEKFVSEIMPKYFKQSRLSSFQRQLNLYGFKRITSGRDAGGYYHELFLQGRPNMCLHMRRVGLPKGEDRRKMRSKNVQVDPDFYSMKPVALTTQESM